jgi:molybdopterin-guanine dinucleotide biosynthesis protein B
MYPAVIGFYGRTDSGKTSLILKLIKRLTTEGYKVATIKKSDKNIGIDTKGKDTWKQSQAGAKLVVFSSIRETDFMVRRKMKTNDIIKSISELGDFDIILVEGARDPSVPKIKIGTIAERKNTIGYYHYNLDEIYTIIKREIDKNSKKPKISVLVNEKSIPLTEFPAEIIQNTIIGIVKSLKGVNKINEVRIHFKT